MVTAVFKYTLELIALLSFIVANHDPDTAHLCQHNHSLLNPILSKSVFHWTISS